VLLAVLPFADVDRPAIGVSLLAAELRARRRSVEIHYFNFDLAEIVGLTLYRQISDAIGSQDLVGEWFFADLVFGAEIAPAHDFLERILAGTPPAVVDGIVRAREFRRAYVQRCAEAIAAKKPSIVGMTTTFHQTCASLAVAKLLKESADPPVIVFGGANCEGVMGERLVRSFPWVDYACTREGDAIFPDFVERVLSGELLSPTPGFVSRGAAPPLEDAGQPFVDLDRLPFPEYDDYFVRVATSPLSAEIEPTILVEGARGCWWGAKHHCTFCGLNGAGLAFRSKNPDRVVNEVLALADRYPGERIDFVDNILDMRYIKTVFPRLCEERPQLDIFFEVKANLRYDQLLTLRAGGVRRIQPGIESLDDGVLRLMDKGCTALQNIALLRWCDELGIEVSWNLIGGFPFEDPAAYERMAALIPLVTHLPAPMSVSPLRLDRFSPLFTEPERFGLQRVRPARAYYFVYPLERRELYELAYFFDFDYGDGRNPQEYMEPTARAVANWWAGMQRPPEQRPALDARWVGDRIVVADTRACAPEREFTITDVKALVFERCDTTQSLPSLLAAPALVRTPSVDVEEALADLVARKLVVEIAGHYLALAVFRERRRAQPAEAKHEKERDEAQAAQPLLPAL
jgi:ribosomal peptide maturation radical SAM protein 1